MNSTRLPRGSSSSSSTSREGSRGSAAAGAETAAAWATTAGQQQETSSINIRNSTERIHSSKRISRCNFCDCCQRYGLCSWLMMTKEKLMIINYKRPTLLLADEDEETHREEDSDSEEKLRMLRLLRAPAATAADAASRSLMWEEADEYICI